MDDEQKLAVLSACLDRQPILDNGGDLDQGRLSGNSGGTTQDCD